MSDRRTLDRDSFIWVAVAVWSSLLPVLPGFPPWLSILLIVVATLGVATGLRGVKLPALLRLPLVMGLAGAAVVSAGAGLSQDTGAALLAAMLASKLLETGTVRDGRSACSFALFALMAGFLRDQGPINLLLALISSILILAALARLARNALHADRTAPKALPALLAAGRLLLISLPFALVAFLLFPRFPAPLWGAPGPGDRARSGLSDEMSPGDIAGMLLDDSPALRVSFEGETPPRSALYWRGPVLSDFDGRRWSRLSGTSFGPTAPLEVHGPRYVHEVMQEPTDFRYLIGLDVPVEAPEDARLGRDRTVYSSTRHLGLRRYRVTSVADVVLEPGLDTSARQRNLYVPSDSNPRTRALIEQWQGEDSRPEALIQRALALFNASFHYSLSPPPLARNSVDDFLFGTQEGYCEHFASAFAVMMRDAGIPTRVVTGYQGGQYNQVGDYWLIRNSDAHAWTEVWLEGRGWVRIDPTAAVAPERIREGLAGLIPPPGAFSRWGQPLWDSLDSMRRAWNYLIVDFDAATQRALFQRLGLDPQDWRQVAIALGIGIVLALGLSFALLWRGGRQRIIDPLQEAWARFCRRLGGAGLIKQADETASALLGRCDALPAADAKATRTLIQRYVSQRYAEAQTTTAQRQSLIADLRRFRISTRVARRAP